MAIDPSSNALLCQNCSARWVGPIDLSMHYFSTSPDQDEIITTVPDLIALDVQITHCPKCPIPRLDDAMQSGDDRSGDS